MIDWEKMREGIDSVEPTTPEIELRKRMMKAVLDFAEDHSEMGEIDVAHHITSVAASLADASVAALIASVAALIASQLADDGPDQWPDSEPEGEEDTAPHGVYFRDVSNLEYIDIYKILELYEVNDHAIGHAIKKLMCAGQRGYKDKLKDVGEAIQTLNRWFEMQEE